MITPSFFDPIENRTQKFSTAVDDYFYLDGISSKTGSHKFTVVKDNEIQRKRYPDKRLPAALILLTIVKIISFMTLVLPLLFLIFKACCRKNNEYKCTIGVPKRLDIKTNQEAAKYLQNQSEQFNKYVGKKKIPISGLSDLSEEEKLTKDSLIVPENGLSNLINKFDNDPDVVFIKEFYINPSNDQEFKVLAESLEAAFTKGAKIAVVRLSSSKHCMLGAFHADGRFKLIDSLMNGTVDIKELTADLNESLIKNAKGKTINFKGEYINTNLQGWSDPQCIRFATLYGYQIAKRKDLDAYQEVNGAFAEGRLKKFEDYNNIDGASKIKAFSPVTSQGRYYKDFMTSWAYRSLNFNHDDWKKIPLTEIKKFKNKSPEVHLILLKKNSNKSPEVKFDSNDKKKFFLKNKNIEMDNIEDLKAHWKQLPLQPAMNLGDLIPQGDEEYTVIAVKNDMTAPNQLTAFSVREEDLKNLRYRAYEGSGKKDHKIKKNSIYID